MPNNNNSRQETIECPVALAEDPQTIASVPSCESRAKSKMESENSQRHFEPEPYSISPDGHYIGCDEYVVPKNFAEFYEREPLSVRRFVMKNLHKREVDPDVEDMEQDLLLHLQRLSENSEHRKEGKTDIIQTFDPEQQHGASTKRFHNYIGCCLTNRLCTLMTKWKRNPLSRHDNLSLADGVQHDDNGHINRASEVGSEYLYNHSSVAAARQGQCDEKDVHDDKIFIKQFQNFVRKERRELLVVLEAIARADSDTEAQEALGINASVFARHREDIRSLGFTFKTGHGIKTPANRKHRRSFGRRYRTPNFDLKTSGIIKRQKATR